MDQYDYAIAFLREQDAGKNGPFEQAAECIEVLLGENYELREQVCPTPAPTPSDVAIKQHEGAARHWVKRWR